MYRKLYRPADETLPAVPMLVFTDQRRAEVIIGLRGLGWGRISDLTSTAPGNVAISTTQLQLSVHGAEMATERTPQQPTPPGWCEAASALSGRCLTIIVPDTVLGTDDEIANMLHTLLNSDSVAAALVPVDHRGS